MFSLRVSIAKRLGLYRKNIRERYPLLLSIVAWMSYVVAARGCIAESFLSLDPLRLMFPFSSTLSANPLGLYEFFE